MQESLAGIGHMAQRYFRMISLKSLWRIFRASTRKTSKSQFSDFSPFDPFARFICSRNHFAPERNIVKPAAFLPSDSNMQLSVFHTKMLSDQEIWELGKRYVALPNRTVHARADFKAESAEKAQLQLTLDNQPPRHANIIGWPPEKSERKLRAMELASMAALSQPVSPIRPHT